MRQTVFSATVMSVPATQGPRTIVSAPSPEPEPVDIALQGGGLSSLQQAFGRLEGGVDPSDHLESLDRVKIDPSTMTELQVPLVQWRCWGWRIRRQRIRAVVSGAVSIDVFVSRTGGGLL